MNEPELKPCPWCGGCVDYVKSDYTSYVDGYAIHCNHCGLMFGVSGRLGEAYTWTVYFETKEEAADAWNSMQERTCHLVDSSYQFVFGDYEGGFAYCYLCSECNTRVKQYYNYCPNCGAKVVNDA